MPSIRKSLNESSSAWSFDLELQLHATEKFGLPKVDGQICQSLLLMMIIKRFGIGVLFLGRKCQRLKHDQVLFCLLEIFDAVLCLFPRSLIVLGILYNVVNDISRGGSDDPSALCSHHLVVILLDKHLRFNYRKHRGKRKCELDLRNTILSY
jgi:hypothetical protein